MGIIITAICVFTLGMTAVWFSPLRPVLLQCVSRLNRFKFTCRATLMTDDSRPASESESLCIQMMGQIPTPCDNFETDLRLTIEDVTAGSSHAEQVLSVDPDYRCGDDAAVFYQTHNGCVPRKNAVLSRWVTVVTIPCHVLRFAYRGRRKLLCQLSILSTETGEVLVDDRQTVEYVYCVEGYRQIQDRKLDIVKASLQLAMMAVGEDTSSDDIKPIFMQWLHQIAQGFSAATELEKSMDSLRLQIDALTIEQVAEPLLAFGEQTDRWCALELILQALAVDKKITSEKSEALLEIAGMLEIKPDRFLVSCQKLLLLEDCQIEDPSFLLGVAPLMDQAVFRAKLNDEYRKWNSRVTHPDKDIRRQADRMLTMIAELRSCKIGHDSLRP